MQESLPHLCSEQQTCYRFTLWKAMYRKADYILATFGSVSIVLAALTGQIVRGQGLVGNQIR